LHDVHACTFLLLIRRRTPRLTLFPYTTLFRSLRLGKTLANRNRNILIGGICGRSVMSLYGPKNRMRVVSFNFYVILVEPYNSLGDRKSTRLNSSHVKISYAVFCLKNKIKMNPY